jgi:group I intron endonuclease
MFVYKITNKINGKCYIGQTRRSVYQRFKGHKFDSRKCVNNPLYKDFHKYGVEIFYIEQIGSYSSYEELNDAEVYFISWYNCMSPNGYNLTSGGNAQKTISNETRRRQSEAKKGMRPWNKGLTGIYSKEHLQKMSEDRKGRPSARKGVVVSQDTRNKIGKANTGKIPSEEHRRKISASLKAHFFRKKLLDLENVKHSAN